MCKGAYLWRRARTGDLISSKREVDETRTAHHDSDTGDQGAYFMDLLSKPRDVKLWLCWVQIQLRTFKVDKVYA